MKKTKLPIWLGLLLTLAGGLAVLVIAVWLGSRGPRYYTAPSKPPHTPHLLPSSWVLTVTAEDGHFVRYLGHHLKEDEPPAAYLGAAVGYILKEDQTIYQSKEECEKDIATVEREEHAKDGHCDPFKRSPAQGVASPSDLMPSATPAQQALMHELRMCLNVDGAESVPADIVSSCPGKNVEILVGVSREDLFSSLGKPTACRRAGSWIKHWTDYVCRDEVDVVYNFFPPCKVGPGTPEVLGILFSTAGVVTQARWERVVLVAGNRRCIP
jgi:hypothetical protein